MAEIKAALNIVLHKNQEIIEANPARNKRVKAGKQFGKTKWLIYALAKRCARIPRGLIWYVAPSYRQAKSIAWSNLKWMIPDSVVKRRIETELIIEFTNDARLELKGADNEDSLRGIPIDGVGWDEDAYIKPYVHDIVASQLIAKKGFDYRISSPNKNGRNHFTLDYEDAMLRMRNGDLDWAAYHYTIHDNPTLDPEEIAKVKQRTTDQTWDLEYLARESEFAGQRFSEFSLARNVGEYEGLRALPAYRSHDWGMDHPAVTLWAKLDTDNRKLYIYDEYVKRGDIVQDLCNVIKEKTGQTPIEWTVIDPSAARRDPFTKRSISDEYARWGVGCVMGDRRERGYDITKMFLKNGLLVISPKCRNLILELQNLQYGDKDGDDCTDALRYLCVRIHDTINGMNVIHEGPIVNFKPKTAMERNAHLITDIKAGDNKEWYFEEAC